MSQESVQFAEMIREYYTLLQIGELERREILLNVAEAEFDGKITKEQADELREYYKRLGENHAISSNA